MTKKQQKIARNKARRKAKARHIRCTRSDINPRKRISPPLVSKKSVLWAHQTHLDRIAVLEKEKQAAAASKEKPESMGDSITRSTRRDYEIVIRTKLAQRLRQYAIQLANADYIRKNALQLKRLAHMHRMRGIFDKGAGDFVTA